MTEILRVQPPEWSKTEQFSTIQKMIELMVRRKLLNLDAVVPMLGYQYQREWTLPGANNKFGTLNAQRLLSLISLEPGSYLHEEFQRAANLYDVLYYVRGGTRFFLPIPWVATVIIGQIDPSAKYIPLTSVRKKLVSMSLPLDDLENIISTDVSYALRTVTNGALEVLAKDELEHMPLRYSLRKGQEADMQVETPIDIALKHLQEITAKYFNPEEQFSSLPAHLLRGMYPAKVLSSAINKFNQHHPTHRLLANGLLYTFSRKDDWLSTQIRKAKNQQLILGQLAHKEGFMFTGSAKKRFEGEYFYNICDEDGKNYEFSDASFNYCFAARAMPHGSLLACMVRINANHRCVITPIPGLEISRLGDVEP
jgi:hypothetical protein